MMQKNHIQSILKINGITPESSEKEVRDVLSGARYSEEEVNYAISMLKTGTAQNLSETDGLHKVFRSNSTLKPSEITSLLAIDVGVDDFPRLHSEKPADLNEPIIFTFATVVISAVGLIVTMYIYEIDILGIAQTAFGGL